MHRLIVALLLAALLLSSCGPAPDGSGGAGATPAVSSTVADQYTLKVGAPAPDFAVLDVDGAPLDLQTLRGKPVWINFWATWCPPCKEEMPLIEQQYGRYRAQGLEIIGINMQESPEDVRAWVAGKFSWRFVIDSRGKLADLYNLAGLPSHVFIDRAGIVRGVQIGPLDGEGMQTRLQPILAAP